MEQKPKKRALKRSFRSAGSGFFYLIQTHRHFLIEILFSGLAVALGLILRISLEEWFVIFILILLGLVIEMLNTSIEELGNAITTDLNPEIKKAKDIAGAAVLLFVIFSVVIAALIFLPKFFIFNP